jgi:hypothetical protein
MPEQRRSRGHAPIVPEARGRCTPPAAPPPPGSRPRPPVPGRITSRTARSTIRVRSRSAGGVVVSGDAASASDRNRRRSLASNPKGRSCVTHRSSRSSTSPTWLHSSPSWSGDRRDDHQPGSDDRREETDHEHRCRECGPRRDGAPAGVVPGATVPGSDRGVSSPGTTVCRNCRRPGRPGRATRVGSCGTRVGDGAHTAVARSRRATWVGQRPAPGWPCATAGAVGAVTG